MCDFSVDLGQIGSGETKRTFTTEPAAINEMARDGLVKRNGLLIEIPEDSRTIGLLIATQPAFPRLNFDASWQSFGRMRPLHTSAVIFAFGGNVLIASSFYVVQRTFRERLVGDIAPWFVVLGYNFLVVIAGTGYLLGITQGNEYAEPEWYADLVLTIVWVTYFLVFLGTVMRRKEPHIYVANWFYLGFILANAVLHLGNNPAVPVSIFSPKSYIPWSGVQDALVQWWYGHVHAGALGWVAYISFGTIYCLVPWLWNEKGLYSIRAVSWHFWISTLGIVLYISSMWVAGILQGLMWRAYTSLGFLEYSFIVTVEAMHPFYIIRALGGALFLAGSLIMAWNVWKTITTAEFVEEALPAQPALVAAE